MDDHFDALVFVFQSGGGVEGGDGLGCVAQFDGGAERGSVLHEGGQGVGAFFERQCLRWGVVAEEVNVQGAAGGVVGDNGFDSRRRGDTDSGGWVEQMDGGGDQSPCLRDVVIAGGGVVGRSGEGEYFSGCDAMA